MATLTKANPEVVGGPIMATTTKLILNGQSWNAGQFLFADSSGLLKTCTSDADASTGGIKYLALSTQTDPGNSTTEEEVGVITHDHIFEGNELDGAVSVSNIGMNYGIDVTSNVVTVDVGDTSNPAVVITDVGSQFSPEQYEASDVCGKLRFQVLTTVIECAGA